MGGACDAGPRVREGLSGVHPQRPGACHMATSAGRSSKLALPRRPRATLIAHTINAKIRPKIGTFEGAIFLRKARVHEIIAYQLLLMEWVGDPGSPSSTQKHPPIGHRLVCLGDHISRKTRLHFGLNTILRIWPLLMAWECERGAILSSHKSCIHW